MQGIPDDFEFETLPEDFDHFEPILEKAVERLPVLADAGIQTFFNGPESFTPDDRYLLGETAEVRDLFVAAGLNSIGIQSSGGADKVLAEWIRDRHPPMDLIDVDIRRMQPFQSGRHYLRDRTTKTLGLLYAMHWPFYQYTSARGARRSPFYEQLVKGGAVMGELSGWERPNWFAPEGVESAYRYSYGRQNWFEHTAECKAVRDAVGLFDQSSFSKFLITGADATRVLNRISTNDIDRPAGSMVHTQWLNERGGIEADLTVTRLAETEFLVVTTAAGQTRDLAWLRRHIPDDARCTAVDVTSGMPMLGLMGPNSCGLLEELSGEDLSNEAFPFATSKEIEIGYARVRASRITYVGELGWELCMPAEFAAYVFEHIGEAGQNFGLTNAGYHAMNACRMEKAYRHWGHDIGDEDTPLEAGLGFAVTFEKPGGFVGREALFRQKEAAIPKRRLAQFELEDDRKLLYHEEPIYRDGDLIGSITSGMYGHRVDASLGMGYLRAPEGLTRDFVQMGSYQIEVAAERIPATAHLSQFMREDLADMA